MRKPKKYLSIVLENVLIEDYAAEGKCIAKIDGEVIFIEGIVAPGDVADIEIYKQKKQYKEARVLKIQKASADRTESFCNHFGTCGGCKWQHLSYESQLKYKQKQVVDAMERIAKVEIPAIEPILGSENLQYYRNKLEFTFSKLRWLTQSEIDSGGEFSRNTLGFHVPKRFDKILEINHCYLQEEPSNKIRNFLNEFCSKHDFEFYDHKNQEGFVRTLTIRTSNLAGLMVILAVARLEMDKINAAMEALKAEFPEISSLNYVINQKLNDTIYDQDIICYHGVPYIEEKMEDLTFRINPKSFFQTNPKQALSLYQLTREFADLQTDELVYDLYTGTGTIANFVAKSVKKVVGLEYVPEAIVDANINSSLNGIENVEFFAGDMRKLLTKEFFDINGYPDTIITDPPRAGMDKEVVAAIVAAKPKKIVYVSCNPATQARDIALMDEFYEVKRIKPVDMFPHTHHVENIVLLNLRK